MADLARLADDLSALSVIEAAQLSKMLEEKWGVSAAAQSLLRRPEVEQLPQLPKPPQNRPSSI